jgi:GMP synthase-like glutamine amidotransferase
MVKINILLCDTFSGLLPPEIPSYAGMFQRLFTLVDPDVQLDIFDIRQKSYPSALSDKELYLVTGSNASAYDDTDWVAQLQEFIRLLYAKKMKITGVCFGHQVVAQALGGSVVRAAQGWGAGVRAAQVVDDSAMRYFPRGHMRLFYHHHDQVTALPPDAVRFATSEFCPNEGFFIGRHVLTFQGHPEHTQAYNRYLLLHHAHDEPAQVRADALQSLTAETDHLAAVRWMLDMVKK